MIKFDKKTREEFLNIQKTKKVTLEGNILKLIDADGDVEFENYIKDCIAKDAAVRRKRLDINIKTQAQNTELTKWKEENVRIQEELVQSLEDTKKAKEEAEDSREESEKARIEAEAAKDIAEKAMEEAEIAKSEAINAKNEAENDLILVQKKSQFELIGTIVRVALYVIIGVGVVTTSVYLIALFNKVDTGVIASTWSNIVGIMLTNAFSIVGTIMGVKYASEKKE